MVSCIIQNEEVIITNGKLPARLNADWHISQNTARFIATIRPPSKG
jgi:hypothetical protein